MDTRNADDLLAVAAIMRLDDNWQDANDTLRRAVLADRATQGQTFIGVRSFWKSTPSPKPRPPSALPWQPTRPTLMPTWDWPMCICASTMTWRPPRVSWPPPCRVNSRHAGALALRAEMALDGEDFAAAAALIGEIRRTNPRDPTSAWLAAARARLLDDTRGYQQERDAHAAIHPRDGEFFAATADMLIRHRRTEDARAVAEEGAAVDANNARCQSVLGTTLLRLGNEVDGIAALRSAWRTRPL